MENFDLIEQYLAGKLEGKEKEAFELRMSQDSELKSEVNFQSQVIESVKKTRAAELKQMLSKVPVASPVIVEFSVLKIAASIIGGGAILAAVYFYYQPDASHLAPKVSTSIEDTIPGKVLLDSGAEEEPQTNAKLEESKSSENNVRELPKSRTEKEPETTEKLSVPQKEKIEVIDPTNEISSQEVEEVNPGAKATIRPASVEVDVARADKKHSFHYQFARGKLVLFGSFDKGLYEVLEINGETRSLFLYYKSAYHLLDESKTDIIPLEPIQNQTIIKKLNQYRGR